MKKQILSICATAGLVVFGFGILAHADLGLRHLDSKQNTVKSNLTIELDQANGNFYPVDHGPIASKSLEERYLILQDIEKVAAR